MPYHGGWPGANSLSLLPAGVAAPPRAAEAGRKHGVWAVWGRNRPADGAGQTSIALN